MIKSSWFCFWAAGCPGLRPNVQASRRMSGPHARYSGLAIPVCSFVLCCCRMSGPLRRMSGLPVLPGCPGFSAGYPGIAIQRTCLCWAARRMSGHLPDVRAFLLCRMSRLGPRMSGPSVLFFCFCSVLAAYDAGYPAPSPDVRPTHSLTLQRPYSSSHYIYPLFSTGEG